MTSAAQRTAVLISSLQAAVPLWAAQLRELDDEPRWALMQRWRDAAWEPLAHMSDVGMMGGGSKGEAAGWFNHLARAIAVMSFAAGGVTVFGLHWCQDHGGCSEYLIASRVDIFECGGDLRAAFARADRRDANGVYADQRPLRRDGEAAVPGALDHRRVAL